MTVDYDLVVVGATIAGEAAAIAAAKSYARVAWILETEFQPDYVTLFSTLATQVRQGLSLQSLAQAMPWLTEQWQVQHSLSEVQARGVDILTGDFQFQTIPSLAVEIGQRRLRSRTYLLALPAFSPQPNANSVAALWQRFQQSPRSQWPKSIACIGDSPQAAALSQSLNQLGCQAMWVIPSANLLPTEDPDLVQWLKTDLESNGVTLIPNGQVVSRSLQVITVGSEEQAHPVDAVVMFSEAAPAIRGLEKFSAGLDALNLRRTATGLWVNPALKTSQPQIYACGALLGGYNITSLAIREAEWAVQNALFRQNKPILYHHLPYAITPNAARVGLTEQQALDSDSTTQVIQFPTLASEQFSQRSPALRFCKLLVQPQGRVLGAHFGGEAATELSYLLAIAMQQNASLESLAIHPLLHPVVAQWQDISRKRNRDRWERQFYRQRRR
jgi:pyruvate/2-oxoglutarate dehydrogenase complex dihydrolipoamide dehydrogenase (E3) component